ncbi:hypothetical protein BgAZ_202500 [Babesia gibsoni]|uniref:RING-type domain-containing protein n=1 Tax=Babesia gibsoni TaxID=33632 RepID=A0AAD8PDV3_BABGI|nr:hypothetical protein BgAZ_202500 [Babesia gibsoni]
MVASITENAAGEDPDDGYLGSQLQFNCGPLDNVLEYLVGTNSYRQHGNTSRRSDIVMDYVVVDPPRALSFVQRAMLCGIAMNVMVFLTESVIRFVSYPKAVMINPSIALWLTVNKALQFMQVPLRTFLLVLLARLRGRRRQEIMYCMAVLTTCRLWFWSKCLTLVNYMWYGVGFAFSSTLNIRSEEWITTMAAYVLGVILFRIVVTFVLVYQILPTSSTRSMHKPPDRRAHLALPSCLYKDTSNLKSTTCGICLDEFDQEDTLRVLNCRHGFHAICIDAWLSRSRSCPLCMGPVI